MVKKGTLFLVTAPSGAGKTTLVQQVVKRLSGHYALEKVITYTTKLPRLGERHGIEYHFLSEEDFLGRMSRDFFVEYSTAYGAYYGFPKEVISLLDEGKSYMGIVDFAGAQSIKAYYAEAVLIGIRPPHYDALKERLTQRAEDSLVDISFRLGLAHDELAYLDEGLFKYIIINDDFIEAVERLEEIVKNELGV